MKKKQSVIINRIYKSFLILIILLAVQSLCLASSVPDIGMITKLSGEITYWNKTVKEDSKPAQSFMKIRSGDEFKLESDSELELIFFSNGRKEIWKGPAELKLSETSGQIKGGGQNNKLQAAQLPAAVVNEVRKISPLIDPAKLHRSGSSSLRGLNTKEKLPVEKISLKSATLDIEKKEEINSAKQIYKTLASSSSSDDITPVLYLFSVFADYDQFEDIKNLIIKMKEKQPDNPGVEQLAEWLREQAEKQQG